MYSAKMFGDPASGGNALPDEFFPKDEALWIKQGGISDCYLLSGLYALWRSGEQMQAYLCHMFKRNPDRTASVTIPYSSRDSRIHERIIINQRYGKFEWVDIQETSCVFCLSERRLREIYNPARSNSLGIQVLERLVSYFYNPEIPFEINTGSEASTSSQAMHPSYIAHAQPNRTSGEESCAYLSKLLGLGEPTRLEFEDVKKVSLSWPNAPVYVSFRWNGSATRHATVLHRVTDETVLLINPHDTEVAPLCYRIDELLIKDPKFFLLAFQDRLPRLYQAYDYQFQRGKKGINQLPSPLLRLILTESPVKVFPASSSLWSDTWLIHFTLGYGLAPLCINAAGSGRTLLSSLLLSGKLTSPPVFNQLLLAIAKEAEYGIEFLLQAPDHLIELNTWTHPDEMELLYSEECQRRVTKYASYLATFSLPGVDLNAPLFSQLFNLDCFSDLLAACPEALNKLVNLIMKQACSLNFDQQERLELVLEKFGSQLSCDKDEFIKKLNQDTPKLG